jgi:hypothetical protein
MQSIKNYLNLKRLMKFRRRKKFIRIGVTDEMKHEIKLNVNDMNSRKM